MPQLKEKPKIDKYQKKRLGFKIVKTDNQELVEFINQIRPIYNKLWKTNTYIRASAPSYDDVFDYILDDTTKVTVTPGSMLFSCVPEEVNLISGLIRYTMGENSIKEIYNCRGNQGGEYIYMLAEFQNRDGGTLVVL